MTNNEHEHKHAHFHTGYLENKNPKYNHTITVGRSPLFISESHMRNETKHSNAANNNAKSAGSPCGGTTAADIAFQQSSVLKVPFSGPLESVCTAHALTDQHHYPRMLDLNSHSKSFHFQSGLHGKGNQQNCRKTMKTIPTSSGFL